MAAILSLLISFLLFGNSFAAIPKAVCRISDRHLDTCLKNSINKLIPELSKNGITEVGLAPLDPFKIEGFTIEPTGEHFKGVLTVDDIVVEGLVNTVIRAIKSDLNKLKDQTLEIKITNPKLMITGKYSGSAVVEGMKVFGDGNFKIILKKIGATVKIVADSSQVHNGERFLTIRKLNLTPIIGSLSVNATGLFGKNTALARFILEQVNNYWRPFYDSLFPEVKPSLEDVIKDRINLYTADVPVNDILLP